MEVRRPSVPKHVCRQVTDADFDPQPFKQFPYSVPGQSSAVAVCEQWRIVATFSDAVVVDVHVQRLGCLDGNPSRRVRSWTCWSERKHAVAVRSCRSPTDSAERVPRGEVRIRAESCSWSNPRTERWATATTPSSPPHVAVTQRLPCVVFDFRLTDGTQNGLPVLVCNPAVSKKPSE